MVPNDVEMAVQSHRGTSLDFVGGFSFTVYERQL